MPSDINALMGLASGDEGKMAAMAELLRRKQAGASIMALSPDKQVNALGTSQLKSVGTGAQRQGVMNRQAITADALRGQQDRQAAATRGYRDQQQSNWQAGQDVAAEERNIAANKMGKMRQLWDANTKKPAGQVSQMPDGRLVNANTGQPIDMAGLTLKDPNRGRGGGGLGRRMTSKQLKEMQELGVRTKGIDELVSDWKPEFASATLPIGGVENWIAREIPAAATQGMKDQQQWWAGYKNKRELVERHELFGSALTTGEQAEWKKATLNPSMQEDQIERQLVLMQKAQQYIARNFGEDAVAMGWPGGVVDNNLGNWMGPDVTKVPDGIDASEWADLSDDDKTYYMENMQ